MNKINGSAPKSGVFLCLYGPSKAGKTVASAAAGPTGTFIGSPSGLLSARKFLGIEDLDIIPASTVPGAIAAIEKSVKKGVPSIVIDDFSLIVEATINEYESSKGRSGMWSALTRDVLEVRDAARNATEGGAIVIFNCHEQPPRTSSGKFIRGGPALPGQLPEKFSGMVDVIGRAMYEPTAAPWKYQLCFEPQPDYVSGDRLSVFPGKSPMNIAEGLRAGGYAIPYPKGLEWIDGVAEKLSDKIIAEGISKWSELLTNAAEKLRKSKPTAHVRWALQDGLHRATIRHYGAVEVLQAFAAPEESEPLFV